MAGAFLAGLRLKKETPDEIRGFARAMRGLARSPQLPPGTAAVDIVGTGGDGSGSLNLSTGSALLAAACGLPVVKHGNRSVSSRCGSADVLEALGLGLPLDETAAGECLADGGRPACTGEDGLAALEIIIGFHVSDRLRGQWVHLPISGSDRELEVKIG